MVSDAKTSYTANYLKIYFWQGAAFVLRFLSLFIVVPYLTKEPAIYGIYAICVSISIFLNYADLGFLRAGQKYSAECCVRGDRVEEMMFIGFGTFVLLVFTLLCASIFLYLGFHPQSLINGLDSPKNLFIASRLLLILAVFTPVTVLQRMVSMIFNIRLEGYINMRISLLGSIITIGSVFYFFRSGNYYIVQYFLFSQSINFGVVLICFWLAKRNYNYNIKQLFKYVRFDSVIYRKTYDLAYSGLYLMIVWIVFYELDQLAIGKFIGPEKVAVYAVAFAFATFFRTIYGILFSPFTVRANYFVGNGDDEGLKNFTIQIMSLSAPLVILPTISFALVAEPFILSWVGANYIESIDLVIYFSLAYTLSFISYSGSMILIAKLRIRETFIVGTIKPLIYWIGILSTYSFMGLSSFGLFKLTASLISIIYYIYILKKYLEIKFLALTKKIFYPSLLPLIFLVTILIVVNKLMPDEKSRLNLLIVLGVTGSSIIVSFLIQYVMSADIRIVVKNLLRWRVA